MYYDEDSGATNFMAGVLLGAILGAGIALLTAPQSGKSTRARLVRRGRGEGSSAASHEDAEFDRAEIMRNLKRRRRKAGR